MKKLMTCLTVVLFVAVSQAATIKWGANGAAYFDNNKLSSSANDNGVGYLLVFEGNNGVVSSAMITDAYNLWKSSTADTSVVAGPQSSTGLGAISANAIFADNSAVGSSGLTLTDGTTYFANIFFTTRDGVDYYYQSGSTLYDTGGSNWDGTSSTLTATTSLSSPTTWTAVPEPTSMALLVLGVAAIGLRRKLRK